MDGPAIEYYDGTKKWYIDDKLDRKDGPAIEWSNGAKHWFINDKLHRENGPATEYPDGTKQWFINGVSLSNMKDIFIEFNFKSMHAIKA